jgi:mRNA-degrading endonuclease RelE of RelBE toxin-antitoxin system
MDYKIIHQPAVETDITAALDYYSQLNHNLVKQFMFRFEEAIFNISRSPCGFQIKYKEVRTLLLKQFPYHIHYLIDDEAQKIVLLAIIHAYKNPKDYTKR